MPKPRLLKAADHAATDAVLKSSTALIGLILSVLVGCSSIANMTSDYSTTETVLPAKADLVAPIARDVLRDYGFAEIQGQHTKVSGEVAGASPAGEKVRVRLTPAGSRTTRILVSNDASKQVAEDLLREIERRVDAVTIPEEPLPWLRPRPETAAPAED